MFKQRIFAIFIRSVDEYSVNEYLVNEYSVNEYSVNIYSVNKYLVDNYSVDKYLVDEFTGRRIFVASPKHSGKLVQLRRLRLHRRIRSLGSAHRPTHRNLSSLIEVGCINKKDDTPL